MKESLVEKYLMKECLGNRLFCPKVEFISWNGAPDRALFYDGKTTWIELKSSTGKTRAIQDVVIARLERVGVQVHIPRSKQDIDNILEGLLREKV